MISSSKPSKSTLARADSAACPCTSTCAFAIASACTRAIALIHPSSAATFSSALDASPLPDFGSFFSSTSSPSSSSTFPVSLSSRSSTSPSPSESASGSSPFLSLESSSMLSSSSSSRDYSKACLARSSAVIFFSASIFSYISRTCSSSMWSANCVFVRNIGFSSSMKASA